MPVWVEGSDRVIPNKDNFRETILTIPRLWRQTKIIIGEPLEIKEISKQQITTYLEDRLLETSKGVF